MNQPFETTSPARPLDKACIANKSRPLAPIYLSKSSFHWTPNMANVFKMPITYGSLTLKQVNMSSQPFFKTPCVNMTGILKQVMTTGISQPVNKLLLCLAQPLKQPALSLTQPASFNQVPVLYTAGPFKTSMAVGMGARKKVPFRPPNKSSVPVSHRVTMGCLSGMIATMLVHPLDVIKIRMQLYPKGRTNMQMLRRVLDCEGTRALYAGLTAGLLRQATYTTTRLAVYLTLLERYQKSHGGKFPPFSVRLQIAILAGLAGAFTGTPSEVALIRMTAEGRRRRSACSPNCSLACKKVRRTTNAINMLYRLARKEGVRELFRGTTPTLLRSWFVSTAVVSSYGEIQRQLRKMNVKEGFPLHAYAAIFSSLITAFVSSPIDVVKTQYQIRRSEARMTKIFRTLIKDKGVSYLYKGFYPYYIRLTVHTMLTYFFMDTFMDMYLEARRVLV